MTFDQILSDLKKKIYKPVYFLMGDESYYIDRITDYIADNVLTEAEKSFNQLVLYGKDVDIATVINAAKRFPMMANHQVVIVKEAQNIRNMEDLIHYAEKPLKSSILVICYKYKTLDKRRKLYTALGKTGIVFESKKIYDDKLPDWIINNLKSKGYGILPDAAVIMAENLGNDLSKIANEIDKLIIAIPEGEKKITRAMVEENIGISKEFNNFELNKALGTRDVLTANRIIGYFGRNPNNNPMALIITTLFSYFSKVLLYFTIKDKRDNKAVAATLQVHPFFVNDYRQAARNYGAAKVIRVISILREYDMKSKGVDSASYEPGELLKEMVYKILH
ncbi:MAG: DNA polymerase III subunit delta [Bacteroidetes bacterium]|nr:DNA polymerase III subunit delta [Bacteroidota bacterium]